METKQESLFKIMSRKGNKDITKEIMEKMKPVFDSHDFILKFAQKNQKAYAEMISLYVSSKEPFTQAHQQIGKFLLHAKDELGIENMGETVSKNIFGNANENKKWHKNNRSLLRC